MTTGRLARVRRTAVRVLALALLATVLAGALACPYAGHYLIVDEPLDRADALVVLGGADVERWLEAVDLHREGYAPRIVLSPGFDDPLGDRLRARGIRFPRMIDIQREAMLQLGTPEEAIELLPGAYDNTAHEAAGARRLAEARGWTRVIVVTSKYHTRRTQYAFRREFRGSGIDVRVRASRYDEVSPDRWWQDRANLRWVLLEMQKLLSYRLGLGA
ncbi:MAG TPA: YdcF family protein [Vicinamibacterales bacterium]|nr:YdcF family protein [Vicinamibacterales bacterium]